MKSAISLLLGLSPLLTHSLPSIISKRSIVTTPTQVSGKTFDYVIAGGGLTGLTVASKLSENASISVLVIEGGVDNHNDPREYDPEEYGVAFRSDLDYNLTTVPVFGRTHNMVAGKTLGGSSSINGASWTKGAKTQYDMIANIVGDQTWDWASFNQDMLAAEHFNVPSAAIQAKGAKYQAAYHGESGNVQVSYSAGMFGNYQQQALSAAESNWPGLRLVNDVTNGTVNGATTIANMIQPDASQNRSSSFTAWILGKPSTRSNLVILTGYRVIQLNWAKNTTANLVASGVSFQSSSTGKIYSVNASKEVILASGSMQSPQILELSGVGDPAVLKTAGVTLKRSLLGVGKNLQEQTKNTLDFAALSTNFNGSGPSSALAFPNVAQLLGTNFSTVYANTMAGLPSYVAGLQSAGYIVNATATLSIMQSQLYNLFNQSEAALEVFFWLSTTGQTINNDLWNLIPLSRGNLHITSTSSWTHPSINPNYFAHPLDLQLQTLAAMQSRAVYHTQPLSPLVGAENTPGLTKVPANATYDTWATWVKSTFTSVWHPIGTLSMMAEEMGGVVDTTLKVHGTANVRVVDASVLPVQVSAHLSSTLYGVAIKAAAMIIAGQ